MTGIGLFILVLGTGLSLVFEWLGMYKLEKAAITLALLGAFSMLCGVSLWLLKVMP